MTPIWVIQGNLNNDDKQLTVPLAQMDIPFQFINIIPFSDSIPDVEYDGPIIVRGSTTTIKSALAKSWRPGVWHNADFKPSVYLDRYGKHYLNKGTVSTLAEAEIDRPMFIRPNSDYKEFTGGIMTPRELKKLQRGLTLGQYPFDASLELFISEPLTIYHEYRFIVVGGRVISGTSYRYNRHLDRRPSSNILRDEAQKIADIWGPSEVYSLDIGVMKNGDVGVVECNCFNGSGLYGDLKTIVREVTDFVAFRY